MQLFNFAEYGFLFGTRYNYRFIECLHYEYFRLRTTPLFRLRYFYYYLLLTFVCVHRLYLFFYPSTNLDSQILNYDYARIVFGVPTRYIIWVSVNASLYDSFRRYVFNLPLEYFNTFQRAFIGRTEYPASFPIEYFPYEKYRKTSQRLYHWVTYSFVLIWITEFCTFPFTLHKVIPLLWRKSAWEATYLTFGFVWNAYAYHHVGAMMSLVSISGAGLGLPYIYLLGKVFRNMINHVKRIRYKRKLMRWRKNYIELLLFLFKINAFQGTSMASIIVCGTPPHAYLTMYIVSHPNMGFFELINNFIALAIVTTYIFGAHGYLALFSSVPKSAAKTLYGHLSGNKFPGLKLYSRLRIAHLISDIHKKNHSYGYTYGSLGQMSKKSILEFLAFILQLCFMLTR